MNGTVSKIRMYNTKPWQTTTTTDRDDKELAAAEFDFGTFTKLSHNQSWVNGYHGIHEWPSASEYNGRISQGSDALCGTENKSQEIEAHERPDAGFEEQLACRHMWRALKRLKPSSTIANKLWASLLGCLPEAFLMGVASATTPKHLTKITTLRDRETRLKSMKSFWTILISPTSYLPH